MTSTGHYRNLLTDELLEALRRGDRLKELVFDLSTSAKHELVCRADRGKRKRKSAAAIEAGMPRVLEALRTHRQAAEDAVRFWVEKRPPLGPRYLILPKNVQWRDLLLFWLTAIRSERTLPDSISLAIESVIEGKSEELVTHIESAARRWGAATSLLAASDEIDSILGVAARELDRAKQIFDEALASEPLSGDCWERVGTALACLLSRWTDDRVGLATQIDYLRLAAAALEIPLELPTAADKTEGNEVAAVLQAVSPEIRKDLSERAGAILAEVDHFDGVLSRSAVLELSRRLPRDMPTRDLQVLTAEAEALESSGSSGNPSELAPILTVMAQALSGKGSLSEGELAWLETELTAKTLKLVRTGDLRLVDERVEPAEVRSADQPAKLTSGPREGAVEDASLEGLEVEATKAKARRDEESVDGDNVADDGAEVYGYSSRGLDEVEYQPQSASDGAGLSSRQDLGSTEAQDGPRVPQPSIKLAEITSTAEADDSADLTVHAPPEVPIPPPGDAGALAQHLLDHPASRGAHISSLLARLLGERRLDDAYWLAVVLGDESTLPVWLVESAQLGLQLRPGFQESERRLRTLIAEAPGKVGDLEPHGLLLLAAACFRPALVAPAQIYPVLILHQLINEAPAMPGLRALLEGLADFAEKGKPLSSALLSGLSSTDRLDEERTDLEAATNRWLEEAPLRNVKFQAATSVWKHWSGPQGELRKLVVTARGGKLTKNQLIQLTDQWGDRDHFTEVLDRTDREISKRLKWKPIRFGAFDAIRRLVGEALDLATRWQGIAEAASEIRAGARGFELEVLRDLKLASEELIKGLAEGLDNRDELAVACRTVLSATANEVISDFESVAAAAPSRDPALEREKILPLIPEVDPDEAMASGADVLLEGVIRHVARPYTLEEAAREQLERGRLAVADSLAEDAGIELAEKARHARDWRRRAEHAIDRLAEDVEHRQLQGVLTEKQKAEFDSRVEALRRELESIPDRPDKVVDTCECLADQLATLTRKKAKELEGRLASLERQAENRQVSLPKDVMDRVRDHLAGDFLEVVSEQIAEIQQGIDRGRINPDRLLESPSELRYFDEFFASLEDLPGACLDMVRVEVAISAGDAELGLPDLDPEQRSAATEALKAWRSLQTRLPKGSEKKHVKPLLDVLRWLGFQLEEGATSPATPRDGRSVHFRVAGTIEAPIPRFGSGAHGRHEVVLAWPSPEPEGIAQWIESNQRITSDQPVTLLCLWPLDRAARRRWIHALRRQKRCVLLIDSCLVTWLCRYGAALRTRALFATGLPGGFDNPYMPEAAGGVAPEMFFGRDQHVEKLWRPEGPCIVFGGRQLGKSALLRQVVRRYHDPADDRFVLYEGLRYQADIFELLRELLVRESLLSKRGLQGAAKIKGAIAHALRTNPGRRVLVLLDECDQFLDEDSKKGFEQVSELRNLMTETERRFKVVFAGLHNVQRFQRIPNQPLAHFGEPLCVEPLEPPAGRDLVRVPFESLGYRFEPETLANRILAHTNSHPSLTQLFCHALMDELRSRQAQRREDTPPFVIDEAVVASVYRNVSLGERMRARFDWTLDLDLRYRLLGYTFAFLEYEGGFGTADGVPTHEVLEWARTTWPEGFAAANEDELNGLLEEMKGLGILVGGPARGYHLRSPNVLRLLGGVDEVHRELEGFAKRPFEPRPEPQVIRRVPRLKDLPASPLSLDQEGRVLTRERGLVLVLGSHALGLDHVWPAIRDLVEDQGGEEWLTWPVETSGNSEGALTAIKSIYHDKDVPGLLIHLEIKNASVDEQFSVLTEIGGWLDRLTHERRFVRIVASLGARSILEGRVSGALGRLEGQSGVSLHRLRRWKEEGLRRWFHDADYTPESSDAPKSWIAETGGWPLLLDPLLRARQRGDKEEKAFGKFRLPAGDILEQAGLEPGSPALALFRVLAQLDEEIDVLEDLPAFVQDEEELDGSLDPLIWALLDLDLLVGSRQKVRAEPVMAALAAER